MYSLKNIIIFVGFVTYVTAVSSSTYNNYENDPNEMRSPCNVGDPLGCLQMKAWNFISSLFSKDTFNLSNLIKINRNSYIPQYRSNDESLEDKVERYIQTHNVNVDLPIIGANIEMATRNIDNSEIDFKVNFADTSEGRKKSKLKKILIPIIAFVLLKAVILVPLALGIMGLKAFNALQLSFVTFVTTLVLAVYQFCKKMAADSVPVPAHVAWEAPYRQKRSANNAQELAYNAYRN